MKLLLLNGHGINMHVDGAKLYIKDGRFSTQEEPQQYIFAPKRIDLDNYNLWKKRKYNIRSNQVANQAQCSSNYPELEWKIIDNNASSRKRAS